MILKKELFKSDTMPIQKQKFSSSCTNAWKWKLETQFCSCPEKNWCCMHGGII